jgi:hypothetical protein
MISWEGCFNWQGHAQTGRPDFLNYLNAGDVSWDELWDFYRREPAPEEAIRALTRLFHIFQSSQYDLTGCWLDPDGEVYTRLRHWSEFAQDSEERVPTAELRRDLASLVGMGLITPLYYQAVYTVFTETTVDRMAAAWSDGQRRPHVSECLDLPEAADRWLPVYHPGPARYPHLLQDAAWNACLRAHLADGYRDWNGLFATHMPDLDQDEAWTTVGGEA